MFTFISRRILQGLATLLASSFLMYLMVSVSIRPLDDLLESTSPNKAQLIAARRALLDLDTPVVVRYVKWLGNFLTGDLGTAWVSGQAVSDKLGGAVVSTLQLVSAATLLAILFGVAVGIVSALRQYTSFDYLITFVSFVLYSLPAFWVAVLLKQWGAIGFNDFLADASQSWPAMIGAGVVLGVVAALAVGGDARRRVIGFAIGAVATTAVLAYLSLSGWWKTPHLGPVLIAVVGTGIAFGITTLSTGLRNRRSLGSAVSVVVLGIVLYTPLQYLFAYVPMSWPLALALGGVAIGSGWLVGRLWGGPDHGQSSRTAALTALAVSAMIFIDEVMQVWPKYFAAPAINGRPIATVGDRTPNLGGDFWVRTLDTYTHLLLPTMALLLISFAGYTRFSRASMLEVMGQDYIRTARAKGLSERTVVMRHGFRNSMIPLATIVPLDIVALFGGAIITEQVFGRPGMGQLFIKSLHNAEIEPIMAYLVITAGLAVLANILADLIYAALDPRIRVNA
ncbi:ABC transporter permease [Cellulomonas cellasea]|uniref:ABC transporter permease n=1 Tax=Cellulomonas cellasea TaxID=43670 RepID=UPI0025A3E480|nr:ABC transporter permease [Cellulomonas cellasea]MDM8083161.1 ABC transporter permease [Cellulomonas cellasea]